MDDELNGQVEGQDPIQPEGQEEVVAESPATVRIREQEIPVSEIEKVWDTYQKDTNWQKANTHRAMELAEQRKQLDYALKIENFVKDHPELKSKLEQTFQEFAKPSGGGEQPGLQNVLEEVRTLKQTFAEERAGAEIRSEMAQVKETFKDFFAKDKDLDKKIVQYALERNLNSLEDAAKAFLWPMAQEMYLSAGQAKREEARRKSGTLGNAAPGAHGGPVKTEIRKKDYTELAREFMEKNGG